ncbi:GxxExxY protein [Candidatus Roizmanbacteria bacterium CG02_land_8_20_14_3_00_36_15]|uniref:GxxExxY protein n=2 Tax=Candidatus Roizmaniibacteriota TaxID=1752723 RepID=A0A2M8KLF1_9BACT|nr:MAG: GxxExxY protein [Candidatus Roizmanbacteria bacterium CG03_land_8_20_14_0_80_36_21]PIV37723.1 MAG: GxxExxY protein [Candidatus Roizmanbacteria bacterium CG02_land_8_20_14_3_00_36_15]PIY70614.1 MAG: GxxExxY protein [Candidatus Roizmanbacteria bacterium CG_4_10_14_0_8_um_filter_36_36]PJA53553.1 MAG: GxxExxY protein [Candidatus Roizmanbacteria bacterium CG_4_9_14_3_um_filter_36_11]PJC81831.1 MAG: GxxExxY protein [Candidatus Roizmanbacteria bacterium CG_4_8_14_3_um_filter_36_10]PJE60746.1 
MGRIIYPNLCFKINGILFKTHNQLGKFCSEKQYCDLIEKFLKESSLLFEREKTLPRIFKEEKEGRNKVDFFVENKVILEAKSKKIITKDDYYQVRRYLSVLNKKLGILVNFRCTYLHPKRILNSEANE